MFSHFKEPAGVGGDADGFVSIVFQQGYEVGLRRGQALNLIAQRDRHRVWYAAGVNASIGFDYGLVQEGHIEIVALTSVADTCCRREKLDMVG